MALFDRPDAAQVKANWQFVRRVGKLYLIPLFIIAAFCVGVLIYAHGFQDGVAFILNKKESES